VGFRPFVYRLAARHGIVGQVQNRLGEVDIVASGAADELRRFEEELVTKAPPLSRPVITRVEHVEIRHDPDFSIAPSSSDADARIFVPPDYFMCDDCAANCRIRPTGATVTRLSTAPSAARGIR
jgi:hydrogenase maturation protein HypF